MGWNCQPTAAVIMENCRVPAANMLGGEYTPLALSGKACEPEIVVKIQARERARTTQFLRDFLRRFESVKVRYDIFGLQEQAKRSVAELAPRQAPLPRGYQRQMVQ